MRFFLISGLSLLLFAGCAAVGPDYVPPDKTLPSKFHTSSLDKNDKAILTASEIESTVDDNEGDFDEPAESVKQVTPSMLVDWWNTLEDPVLTDLIEFAINENLDLKLAQSRLRESRAQRWIAKSIFFPSVDAGGEYTRGRISREVDDEEGDATNFYASGFDASWEIDIFGGIRRSVESATATVQASQEALNDTLVTLVAEVALNYIQIRTFQARLQAAEKNLRMQQDSVQIVQDRFDAGLATSLSLEQAKYNLESTKSEIPVLQTGIEQGKNGLAVLLGNFPGFLEESLKQYIRIPVKSIEVSIGIPADVLRRRPDVRQAERQLAAQTAQIGVATADLYPRFFLLGSVGLETLSASSFFTGPAAAYHIGPQMNWKIFNAGRVRQRIKVESERMSQALIQYERAILNAVSDVENTLIDFANEQVRRQALQQSMESAESAVSLSRELYTAGLTDFIGVLDAERALFSFQDRLALSEGQVTSNLIRLYKSLGGGWKPFMEDVPQEMTSQVDM